MFNVLLFNSIKGYSLVWLLISVFFSKMSKFCKKIEQIRCLLNKLTIRSFAHLWWATSAIRSWLLIFFLQTERFAHSRSFFVSALSDSLTVAHFYWVNWVNRSWSLIWFERNEQISEWAINEWANFQLWKIWTRTRKIWIRTRKIKILTERK